MSDTYSPNYETTEGRVHTVMGQDWDSVLGAAEGEVKGEFGGYFCPCHGSTFDMAGRVYKNKPAPDNLEVPPHMYLSESRLLIGEDKKA